MADNLTIEAEYINQMSSELDEAVSLLEKQQKEMPLTPSSEYLRQMQETALRVEKLQKKIHAIKGDLPSEAKTNISISKFSISPLPQPINSSVAVCSATFYNTLTVNGITINNGRKGLYVKMPQKRTKQGRFLDVCHPLSADERRNINETLISAYLKGNFKQEFEVEYPKEITAQNSVRYPPEYGNSLARMDLVIDDMVVPNAKIINRNGEPRLSMPSYKAKDGSYTTICVPSSKESYAELNSKALEEFNTEYSFRKFSDTDVDALKESGVKFQSRKNENGENIVKFKTADLQKVNAVVSQAPAAPKI